MANNPLAWKLILIAVVVGLATFFAIPPAERVNLGLDLKGGAHIVMQVQTGSALRHETDLALSRIGQYLEDNGIGYGSIDRSADSVLEIRGTDPAQRSQVRSSLQQIYGQWEINDLGSGSWRVSMPPQLRSAVEASAIDITLDILRDRIDLFGVAEPVVQKQGADRIVVQLPGVEDPERVIRILQAQALLQWKEVTYPPGVSNYEAYRPAGSVEEAKAEFGGQLPADTELIPGTIGRGELAAGYVGYWPLKKVSVVIGNDLRDAFRDADEWGSPAVAFELTQDAGRRFDAATQKNVGKIMAIVLGTEEDKKVISHPVIQSRIGSRGIIQGGFTVEEAEDLALQLKSGAIPTDVEIIQNWVIGPSLGRDSIRAGLLSGIAGFAAVLLFMVVYYRLSGINAVVALGLNILLVFGTLGALPVLFAGVRATLTLPGIAGLILTIGMAVDSNVLIFERIREELRVGKTVRSAVEQGFGRAFTTILDCNVTTLVAAFFLFSYGTGPVQGFAVTLTIGLLASMFTAVFVSRQLFEIVLSRRRRAESLSI